MSSLRILCLFVLSLTLPTLQGLKANEKAAGGGANSTINATVLSKPVDPLKTVRQQWVEADKGLKSFMSRFIRSSLPGVMREVYTRNISNTCMAGLLHLSNGLKKTKLWAFEMLDSSGKLPEGFMAGTLTILGNYRECIQIKVNETKRTFRGQYCTVEVTPPLPDWRPFMSFHNAVPELLNVTAPDTVIGRLTEFVHNLHITSLKTSICLPSLCSEDDVDKLIQIIPDRTGIHWKFSVLHCEVEEETVFTPQQQAVLAAFGIIAFFLACGFMVDVFCCEENGPKNGTKWATWIKVLKCFSPIGNARNLAKYVLPEQELRFVYGIMFVMLYWTLVSNNFMYANYDVSSNFIEALSVIQNIFYEMLLNRMVPVQSFFFLSGLVTAYRVLKSKEDFCVWKYVLKKYWRYTVVYALVLGLLMLAPVWGSGPSWKSHLWPIYDNCSKTWWANLLYINNFLKPELQCLDHTWMFAVDAQLHLIGILILLPLKRKPKIGVMVNFFLLGVSLLTVALTNTYYQMPPTELIAFLHTKDRSNYAEHTYYRAYTHLCMYCSGIAVGHLIAQKPQLKIPKKYAAMLWIVTLFGALYTLCAVHEWSLGILPPALTSALYATFGKVAWAAFLSWIAIACVTGNGGVVKDFLSWKPYSFFGRLVFIAYLTHPVLIQVVMGFRKAHQYAEQFEILYPLLSHLSAVYFLSYLCHLAFEAPLMSLSCVIRRNTRCRFFTINPTVAPTSNGVLTEKPMKYATKHAEKQQENNKC